MAVDTAVPTAVERDGRRTAARIGAEKGRTEHGNGKTQEQQ